MPSKSKSQARFMAACAHDAGYASCPPQGVAKEFNQADKGTGILSGHRDAEQGHATDRRRVTAKGYRKSK
jgi:hypothetical protein